MKGIGEIGKIGRGAVFAGALASLTSCILQPKDGYLQTLPEGEVDSSRLECSNLVDTAINDVLGRGLQDRDEAERLSVIFQLSEIKKKASGTDSEKMMRICRESIKKVLTQKDGGRQAVY